MIAKDTLILTLRYTKEKKTFKEEEIRSRDEELVNTHLYLESTESPNLNCERHDGSFLLEHWYESLKNHDKVNYNEL